MSFAWAEGIVDKQSTSTTSVPLQINQNPGIPPSLPSAGNATIPRQSINQELKDIYNPVKIGNFWETPWFIGSSIALIALLLSLLIGKLLKKKPVITPLDPYIEAIGSLSLAKEFIKSDQKKFAIILSDAVRNYLDKDFGVPAMERTTEEFVREALRELTFVPKKQLSELENLLTNCDLAKFAKQVFITKDLEDFYQQAHNFIEYMHMGKTAFGPPKAVFPKPLSEKENIARTKKA